MFDTLSSSEKYSKYQVHYRISAPDMAKRCGNCAMFNRIAKTCDVVEGKIEASSVCDRWQAKP